MADTIQTLGVKFYIWVVGTEMATPILECLMGNVVFALTVHLQPLPCQDTRFTLPLSCRDVFPLETVVRTAGLAAFLNQ